MPIDRKIEAQFISQSGCPTTLSFVRYFTNTVFDPHYYYLRVVIINHILHMKRLKEIKKVFFVQGHTTIK